LKIEGGFERIPVPCPDEDPDCLLHHYVVGTKKVAEEVSTPIAISQRRMQLAGAVEDIVDAHLFAFVALLKDEGHLTDRQAQESLAKFNESLQTPGT